MGAAPLARPGWCCLVGGALAIVAGRLLGLPELFIAGAVLLVLVTLCLAVVLSTRPQLDVDRTVHPTRVHVGTSARVRLTVVNIGRRRSPVVSLSDPVSGTPGAEVLLAPLSSGERATATYQLPTAARGLIRVGPLMVVANDPFGVTRVRRAGAPPVELTVLPRVDQLAPLTDTAGDDPHGGVRPVHRLDRGGDEFHALRPYVVGDDMRRVHWPSTARTDELMVRQDALPWQGRTTVVIDLRASSSTSVILEQIISAAASVLESAWHRGELVRLLTTDGTDSGFAAGHAHLEAIMEHMAVVRAGPDTPLSVVAGLLDKGRRGTLVMIMAHAPASDVAALLDRRGGFRATTLVRFGSPSTDGHRLDGTRLVEVAPGVGFAAAWDQAMAPVRGQRASVR